MQAFATGLRGTVLFSAALMTPLLLRRLDFRFRLFPVVAASLGLLWLISFGRLFRGNADWTEAVRGASLIDALAELGASLRPVFEVVRWTQFEAYSGFFGGGTYWAPIERLFQRRCPSG